MRQIEDGAAGVLTELDHFYAVVKQIVEEEAPVGAKTDKIRQPREGVLREIEGLLRNFDRAALDREKEPMD